MVAGPDPVECVVRAVRDALSPLTKGFESQWASTVQKCSKVGTFESFGGPKGKKMVENGAFEDFRGGERRKGPIRSLFGAFSSNGGRKSSSLRKVGRESEREEVSNCSNCLQFSVAWSLLVSGFVQAFPSPLKSVRECFGNQCRENDAVEVKLCAVPASESRKLVSSDGEMLSLELVLCLALESLVNNLNVIDLARDCGVKSSDKLPDCAVSEPEKFGQWKIVKSLVSRKETNFGKLADYAASEPEKVSQRKKASSNVINGKEAKFDKFLDCVGSGPEKVDHWKIVRNLINGKKVNFDSFIWNMRLARVGGAPEGLVGATASENDEDEKGASSGDRTENEIGPSQNMTSGLLNISLSNVERLKSTLSTVSLTDLIEFIPQLGRPSAEHPDKKKLFSVQDFFRYAEAEGRRFFDELDRDGDGQVNLEDLEIAMRKRKLPRRYAKDFLRRTRSNMFSKSIGWKQFLSLMEQKEPTILRAYTTLCLSKSGTIQNSQILTSLRSAGLPASEDNAAAMMRYLNAEKDASISYSHFRNFMLLLPSERLEEDPRSIWFEAATVVAVPPPVEISAGNVLKSALAGGLASALSTSMLHPIDTMKTRLQASSLSLPELVSTLPQIGIQGLYRGSIPAILGQFSSHGVRTGIFEASKLVLVNVAPTLPEIQVQSLASFCSTILGTAVRIPCEVLKQRLQAGIFDNVGEAIVGTFQQDGLKGFFRGTGATLCREVPFYVAGMCLYAEAKKAAQNLLSRELEPWETIAVGALSGGLAAVVTTPFDVMKTRTMTAPQGLPVSMQMIALSILQKEGPIGFFKGAVPRFFWIAPLGAMNFAGYELAKKAMVKDEQIAV